MFYKIYTYVMLLIFLNEKFLTDKVVFIRQNYAV
jgi:hypothetical protein